MWPSLKKTALSDCRYILLSSLLYRGTLEKPYDTLVMAWSALLFGFMQPSGLHIHSQTAQKLVLSQGNVDAIIA